MRTLVFWCGFAFNCNAASLCAPETPTFISISAFRSNHFVPGLVVICRLKPCCFSEVDLSCVLLFALWMEYSGSFFPPDLSKAELCSSSASGHVMRKKKWSAEFEVWYARQNLTRSDTFSKKKSFIIATLFKHIPLWQRSVYAGTKSSYILCSDLTPSKTQSPEMASIEISPCCH